MSILTRLARDVFAQYDAAGNAKRPGEHADAWGTEIERALTAVATSAAVFASKAGMDSELDFAELTMGWVVADATAANNGVYQKQGASGAGSWIRLGDLPYSFIRATNAGAGTANAIAATTATPIPAADGGALIALPIVTPNTATPVTVAFNGGSALTIKTNTGGDIAAGGLTAGMIVAGYVSGTTFLLLSDQASAAVLAAAEAAADRAELAASSIDLPTAVASTVLVRNAANDAYVPVGSSATSAERIAASRIVVGDTHIDMAARYGVIGADAGDQAKIQNAFDNETIGHELSFPYKSFGMAAPLSMTRLLDLDLGRATIRGDFAGQPTYSVINAGFEAGDVGWGGRHWRISGGRVYTNGGGYAALNINPTGTAATETGLFQSLIENGLYSGHTRGIRLGGAEADGEFNFNTVFHCTVQAQEDSNSAASIDLDNCADGNRFICSMSFGNGVAFKSKLVLGAFNTLNAFNALLNRDGAILITDGSRILNLGNQMEQQGGDNTAVPAAMVRVQGLDYPSAGNIFHYNNYGGGSFVDYNMVLYRAYMNVIDYEQFNPPDQTGSAGHDIWFADGGSGLIPVLNTVGPNNHPRGIRTVQAAPTDVTRRLRIKMDTNARNQRGVWRPSSHLTLLNSWTAPNLEFMLDEWGRLWWDGDFTGGNVAGGTTIVTMPEGLRPRNSTRLPIVAPNGTAGAIAISSSGNISVISVPASPNNTIHMTGVAYPVMWLPDSLYDDGPA